jgi:hypothetical protein
VCPVIEQTRCHAAASESATQARPVLGGGQRHPTFVQFELYVHPGTQTRTLTQIFGNHDLPLRADPMSHT